MRLLYTTLLLLTLTTLLTAQDIRTEVVAKKLLDKIAEQPEGFHSVHIVLADVVDLARLDAGLTAIRASATERPKVVIEALQTKAQETQGGLFFLLKNSPLVKTETVRSYWIANAIFAQMKKDMIAQLSQRPDVAWIGLNGKLELEKYETALPPAVTPNGKEPGLGAIKAPAMWAMGYTGYGQVAFTNDTGVDPTHPAVASRYRGFYVPKEQTWFEVDSLLVPTGNYTPVDCQFHGTHVTGTILGLDRMNNDTIGVAFNSQWIGAPTVSPCSTSGTEDNAAAFQWSIDPDGNPNTSDDIPDVINNSWYDPSLDTIDCFSLYVPILEAMEVAGIAVVFSAGNQGPGPMTISPPHNVNLNLVNSFSVGALNGNVPTFPIASFSSRGPSHCVTSDSSLLIKPEVSAPGQSVRSCVPGNDYTFLNGTSMASPHVSGAILLLKEAFPDLTGKELKLALYFSCTDLGTPGEDNTYGMGIINVPAAFNYLVDQGHVPVSPYRANDVMVVDMQLSKFSCEEEITPVVTIENAGTDTLYSFDVFYEAGIFNTTYSWTGTLAPLGRVTLKLPALMAAAGTYELSLNLKNPNGVADERPLNNRFNLPVKVTKRERFTAQVEGSIPFTACEDSPVLLRGEYKGAGKATVKWYDVPVGGSLLGEGIIYVTPPVTASKSFYAEAAYTEPLGLADKNAGSGIYSDTAGRGQVFNAYHDIILKSVWVNINQTGGRIIELYNAQGNLLSSAVKFLNDTGKVQINLDWKVKPGFGYRLIRRGGKPFYHNTSGASYPYSIDGIVEITGTTDVLPDAWYYFYDWQVQYAEPCGRSEVPVEVKPGNSFPAASFTMSQDSLVLPDNGSVHFTNTSTGTVAAWHWNFGDGNTSAEEHPGHAYTTPGTYIVSLTIIDLSGCSAFALDTIFVEKKQLSDVKPAPPLADNIAVFPNPARDAFTVHLDLTAPQPVTLKLADITGRVVKMAVFPSVQKDGLRLDAANLPEGVYILLIELEGRTSVWKVVKM